MSDTVLLLGVFATAYIGFALLALSQKRHWSAVTGSTLPRRVQVIALRVGAYAMIAVSLVLAFVRDGDSFGSLLWATAISLATLAVAFTLAWRPGLLRPLALCVAPFARSRSGRCLRYVTNHLR